MTAVRRLTRETLLHGVDHLCSADPDLRDVVDRYGPPPLWARRPGFTTLVRIILEQQVSLASADSTFKRLDHAMDGVTPDNISQLSLAELRGLGFTRQKAGYCLDLARLIVAGGLDLALVSRADDAEARAALLGVRGIGPWSADVYLLMALRRPDVWPDGDVALAAAAHRVKRLRQRPKFDRLGKIAAKWRPWRSVAARILWHHYLSARRERASRSASREGNRSNRRLDKGARA